LLPPRELEGLSEKELEAELTVAASTPGRRRWDWYDRLLVERSRRRPVTA
jgi:hypothetical protein